MEFLLTEGYSGFGFLFWIFSEARLRGRDVLERDFFIGSMVSEGGGISMVWWSGEGFGCGDVLIFQVKMAGIC